MKLFLTSFAALLGLSTVTAQADVSFSSSTGTFTLDASTSTTSFQYSSGVPAGGKVICSLSCVALDAGSLALEWKVGDFSSAADGVGNYGDCSDIGVPLFEEENNESFDQDLYIFFEFSTGTGEFTGSLECDEVTAPPTATPTVEPTFQPTAVPTATPTVEPTALPTATPTVEPTSEPTTLPTATPTMEPPSQPMALPTAKPTVEPPSQPMVLPTVAPTVEPASQPMALPTVKPTLQFPPTPMALPTLKPTVEPPSQPMALPTAKPTVEPASQPMALPTAKPTVEPPSQPMVLPTVAPTVKPATQPMALPTVKPTSQSPPTPTLASPEPTIFNWNNVETIFSEPVSINLNPNTRTGVVQFLPVIRDESDTHVEDSVFCMFLLGCPETRVKGVWALVSTDGIPQEEGETSWINLPCDGCGFINRKNDASVGVRLHFLLEASGSQGSCSVRCEHQLGRRKSSCFPASATVQFPGGGQVHMQELQVRDHVLVDPNKDRYETVYGFGHYSRNEHDSFVQIHTRSTGHNPLELSRNHLIYIDGIPVRADEAKVGDEVLDSNGEVMPITKISSVTKEGLYMPLTPSGRIVVNGIQVSNYVSIKHHAPASLNHPWVFLSEHYIVHLWLSPYRTLCLGVSSKFCQLPEHTDGDVMSGIHPWLLHGIEVAKFAERLPFPIKFVMGSSLLITFVFLYVLELLVLSPFLRAAVILSMAICGMKLFGVQRPRVQSIKKAFNRKKVD